MRSASAVILRSALLDCVRQGRLSAFLAELAPEELRFLIHDWAIWARDDQLPPGGDPSWTTWLILGGRGAGKTRAGAEWVRSVALGAWAEAHIALIGETLGDVRSVMIEGLSGLLAVHAPWERPKFEPSKRQLVWPNGAIARMFSADDPESLRGPQFTAAWCDELCKWRFAERAWDMLQFGLRLGERPRQVITTTPRPTPLLKRLMSDPDTVLSRASTDANAANLAPVFLSAIVARYRGTRLGRQELDAEILVDRPDALWRREMIERTRVSCPPETGRRVVAIDPPVTSGPRADACGIVTVGLGIDGRAYVLDDATIAAARPLEWARAAIAAFHRAEADQLVAEVNQGGELVESVLRQIDPELPITMVRASRGKWVRAEPVAALYEQDRVRHVGAFPALEDEMCDFGRDGLAGAASPDRVDALVWALTDLMLHGRAAPRIRPLY